MIYLDLTYNKLPKSLKQFFKIFFDLELTPNLNESALRKGVNWSDIHELNKNKVVSKIEKSKQTFKFDNTI